MIFLKNFKTLDDARAAGAEGLYSPHFNIVKDKPARNYKIVEGSQTFRAEFDDDGWMIEPSVTVSVGDITYFDDEAAIKTVPLSGWTGQGTAIGVVAILPNFLPDGKMRIVGISDINSEGMPTSGETVAWGDTGITALIRYQRYPNWNNDMSSPVYEESDIASLPSNLGTFSGTTCTCDTLARYKVDTHMAPSPYLNDGSFNTAYSMTIENGNAFSHFRGKENTMALAEPRYPSANACSLYSTPGTASGDWYLPSMGELGVAMTRIKTINDSLSTIGERPIDVNTYYWTVSEYSNEEALCMDLNYAYGSKKAKNSTYRVRPFFSF